MAVITPNTDLYLLKVPIEIDERNQLTFANATAQYNYFTSLTKKGYDKFTYQRKDNTIRIPEQMDDIITYNYVMYRNTSYSNKWFYAFIEDMEYVNDSVTAVKIKTDVYQSWMFELNYKATFVEREHTNDDTIGSNTMPEGLECGEPLTNGTIESAGGTAQGYYITFMVSDTDPLQSNLPEDAQQYNGIFSGYTLFGVNTLAQAKEVVDQYAINQGSQGSYADAIKNIFLVPKELYATATDYGSQVFTFRLYVPQKLLVPVSMTDDKTITRPTTIDGYTPKNNKLFTWPYSYLLVSNNVGSNAEFRYEDFSNATPHFRLAGIISSGCDIKLTPLYYKNISTPNHIYGMKMGKIPVCSWNTDAYAIWLAQNQLNMRVSLTRNTIQAVAGAAIKNPLMIGGAVGSYLGDVLNSMSERYIARHTPDEVHGDPNSSDYNFSASLFFEFRRMSIRAEYARRIDEYFSTFGYATNRVKLPNITGRRNWNYVKTVGCYIDADIPQGDLQEIKDMFDRGVTFWHNPATFADYSQTNDILT